MSKNLWVAGESGNAKGRPKGNRYSVLSTRGRIERFVNKNLSTRALQSMYNKLSARDQYMFLTELLPYMLPKVSADAITPADIERIYAEVQKQIEDNKLSLSERAG